MFSFKLCSTIFFFQLFIYKYSAGDYNWETNDGFCESKEGLEKPPKDYTYPFYPNNYDRMEHPNKHQAAPSVIDYTKTLYFLWWPFQGIPTTINLSLYVESISSISTEDQSLTMMLWPGFMWMDSRLLKTGYSPVDLSFKDKLWVPSVYFFPVKDIKIEEILDKTVTFFVENTTVGLFPLQVMTIFCPMDLSFYPMDKQECFFKLEIVNVDASQAVFAWGDEPLLFRDHYDSGISEYKVSITVEKPLIIKYTRSYTQVKVVINLTRNFFGHLISLYIPSLVFVFLSWITMILPPVMIQPRVTIGVTTVLTIATQAVSIRYKLPPTSVVISIDVWFLACFMADFIILIETVFVGSLSHAISQHKNSSINQEKNFIFNYFIKMNIKAEKIDQVCRRVFFLLFTVFIVIYWLTCLSMTNRL